MHTTLWPAYFRFFIIAVIVFFIWIFNQNYLVPVIIGFFVSALTFPIMSFLTGSFDKLFDLTKIKFLHIKFLHKLSKGLAIFLTVILITGIVIWAVQFLTGQILLESRGFLDKIINILYSLKDNSDVQELLNRFFQKDSIPKFFDTLIEEISRFGVGNQKPDLDYVIRSGDLNWIPRVAGQLLNTLVQQISYAVVFYISWITGLGNGKKWIDNFFLLLPIDSEDREMIVKDVNSGIRNVIYANILSGLIHTAFCFVIMMFFKVESIWIYSIIIFFIGVLPLSPSELAYIIPLSYVFGYNVILGFVLAIISELLILMTNYYILPKVIASQEDGSPLLILTSVLSGISLFGIMGFLISPVIMVFTNTLFKILIKNSKSAKGIDSETNSAMQTQDQFGFKIKVPFSIWNRNISKKTITQNRL